MKYLVDTGALVRIGRRQVEPVWYDVIDRGLVAICEPVLVETLTAADAKSYARAEETLRAAYTWVPVPDDVVDVVMVGQRPTLSTVHCGQRRKFVAAPVT